MPVAFLLALQAAGMVFDFIGTKQQQDWQKLGATAEQAGIEANIDMNRLEAENETVSAMKQLRQNIGTQIATYAARGTALGAGSSLLSINESLSNFKADERTRRLNTLGKENQLRGGAALSRLQNMSDTSKLWQGFASRTLNKFPTSPEAFTKGWSDIKEGFGLTKFFG